MSYTKFGPDRFSRFDVYGIQTNKQTNRHPDKPNLYIDSISCIVIVPNRGITEKKKLSFDPQIKSI